MAIRPHALIYFAAVLIAASDSTVAQMASESFVVPSWVAMDAGGQSGSVGISLGQSVPIGLAASADGGRFHSGGFWTTTGGTISATACPGDCNRDGAVNINELVLAVNIALGRRPLAVCRGADTNRDDSVRINELIQAVGAALDGCSGLQALSLPPRGDNTVPGAVNLQGTAIVEPGLEAPAAIDTEVGIWDQSSGGALLYGEHFTDTPLTNGVFNLLVGDGSQRTGTLDAETWEGDERWLELSIDGEISERLPLAAVTYAMRADTAARATEARALSGMEAGRPVSSEGDTFTGTVILSGPGGGNAVSLTTPPGAPDHGRISVGDEQNGELATMLADGDGSGRLMLRDSAGTELASVGTDVGGAQAATSGPGEPSVGRVVVRGPNGELNARLTTLGSFSNHGAVWVHGADGLPNSGIEADTTDAGYVAIGGSNGTLGVELFGHAGTVQARNQEFEPVASMTSVGQVDGDSEALNRGIVLVRRPGPSANPAAAISAGPRGEGIFRTFGPNDRLNVEMGGAAENPNRGRLSLYDQDGAERLVADARESGSGSLEAADEQGRVRATISGLGFIVAESAKREQGAFLGHTDDSTEHGRIGIGDLETGSFADLLVSAGGQGQLVVNRLAGTVASVIRVLEEPQVGIAETLGPNGKDNVTLSALASNADHGFVAIKDADGERQARLYAASDETGRLTVHNDDGATRAQFQVSQNTGVIETRGPNGEENVLVSATVSDPELGIVSVRNVSGDIRGKLEHFLTTSSTARAGRLALFGPRGSSTVTATVGNASANSGFLYINTGQASIIAGASGTYHAELKNFVVDHPRVPGTKIVYAAVEGPEAAIYHRGTARLRDGRGEIVLPEHFAALASPGSITVQLTPGSARSRGVGFGAIEDGNIEIGELRGGRGSYDVYFTVHAVRRGYEDYRPVVEAEGNAITAIVQAVTPSESTQIEALPEDDATLDESEEDGEARSYRSMVAERKP